MFLSGIIGEEPPRLVVLGAALGPSEQVQQVLGPLLALGPIQSQVCARELRCS